MEIKANEATPLRPEGDRILDAPLVHIDLPEFIKQLKQEPTWETSTQNSISIYKSTDLTIILIGMHPGGEMKKHTAKGNITVQVIEGFINFTTDTQNVALNKGQMIALHANIPHNVSAVSESFFLLTMHLS